MDDRLRVFSEGFRIFFLSAGVFGCLAMTLWWLWLADVHAFWETSAMMPQHWHAHEMIFGYAAAIGGFFLTAVPNWTNSRGAGSAFIFTVFALWLLGRGAVLLAAAVPPMLVMVLDLLFLPVLSGQVLLQLLKKPKPQNLLFLIMLSALWCSNLLVHLEWVGLTEDTAEVGLRGGLMTLAALIGVLGGRVTPTFTRNAMKRQGIAEQELPATAPLLDKACILSAVLLPWAVLSGVTWLGAGVAFFAACVQALRLAGWKGLWTCSQPILWSLHLGMAFLALGLLLWGLAGFGLGDELAGLHVLAIGSVGGMTLAVMSRAVLGHTGRVLQVPVAVAWGFGAMAFSAVVRWVGQSVWLDLYSVTLTLSSLSWIVAMGLFLAAMGRMMFAARVDTAG
ncbi:NnrS family protein [Shimia sp. R11_0]|uniref:NnrS family protein n=1 Tax=Shimia sp. R11_0 TaxID=2821096 RepID=UPI001ADB38F6|nr:NnrS family protein [Shimia sp. R11_0]MBO9478052.1 NnrS family protein [Shimia sp. R11_0]